MSACHGKLLLIELKARCRELARDGSLQDRSGKPFEWRSTCFFKAFNGVFRLFLVDFRWFYCFLGWLFHVFDLLLGALGLLPDPDAGGKGL